MKFKKFIKEKFWVIYFAAICLILVWKLFTCGTTTFESDILGVSADEEYEILDDSVLETVFRVGRDKPEGFLIYNYQIGNIKCEEQKLIFTFWDENSGKRIQQTELNTANQVRNLYVSFEEEIPVGTYLRMQIQSEGFKSKGPTINFSDTGVLGSTLWKNGQLLDGYLCGALCYNTVSYNYIKPIMYFLAELIVGIVLLMAEKRLKLPFYIRAERARSAVRKKNWKKAMSVMGIVLVLLIVFLDYVYTYTIEEAVDKRDYSVICKEGKAGGQQLILKEGEEVAQIFSVKGNNFSGMGINIQNSKAAKGVLRCYLYDLASGELLLEKAYEISSLKKLSEYVAHDEISDYDKDIIKQYVALDWQGILEDSQEKFYKLILKGENLSDGEISLALSEGNNFSVIKDGRTVNGNLCMVSLYSNDLFLKTMFKWMAGIVVLFFVLISGYLCVRIVATEKVFAINALVLGLIFCFLIPPYCVPDEWAHFDGVYRISNEMLGITESPGPNRIYKRACDIAGECYATLSITSEEYQVVYENLGKESDDETLTMGYADNSVTNVTAFNYIPSAVGFTLARLMHMNHISMLILGRIFNLLAVIAMMYIAIKKAPFGKSVIAVTGLLPITLQQMASCSYDGVIIGVAYIFVAYCLHIIFDENKSIMDIMVMSLAGCILAACKGGVYTPVLGLVLLIPFSGKHFQKRKLIGIVGIVVSMILVFLAQFSGMIVTLFSQAQGTSFRMGAIGGVELYTVSYFIQYPKELIRVIQNTFALMGDFYVQGVLGGALGVMDIKLPWFLLIAFFVLLYMCIFKKKDSEKSFCKGQQIYVGFLCLASVLLVFLSMLLAWTSVGAEAIQGVQGRYFIPIIGLVLLTFRSNVVKRTKRGDVLALSAGILDVCAVGFTLLSIY